jgi:RimJ/RimL family protein N-acetyltransferase
LPDVQKVRQARSVSTLAAGFSGPIPTLTDGVVTLRRPLDSDTQTFIEYSADPDMRRWIGFSEPFTAADAEAVHARVRADWVSGERYQFVIEADGKMIGGINLHPQGAGLAEVEYGLGGAHRGRGLMSRAVRLVLDWGFRDAGIEVVHWRAQVGDWASRRVAWAAGFRVDAVTPALLKHRGSRVDGWLAALCRGDQLQPVHPWYEPARVIGKTVVLRAHREQDLPRMVEACRDPESRRWLTALPGDYTEAKAREQLARIRAEQASGRALYWAVADPDDDRMLGQLGLFVREAPDRQGEIGYWVHPDARGRGVMTQSVRLAARHALLPVEDGGLGMPRLLLRAAERNTASIRVAQKAGFTRSGLDRQGYLLRDGTRANDVRFDLLADELPAVR